MPSERERIPIAFSSADITLFKTTSILVLRYLEGVVGVSPFSFPPLKIPEIAYPPPPLYYHLLHADWAHYSGFACLLPSSTSRDETELPVAASAQLPLI